MGDYQRGGRRMKKKWEYIALSSVCKVQNGFAFNSKLFNESNNGLPLIRIRDIKRGYSLTYTDETCSDDFFVEDGDMLIGMDGDFNIGEWKGGHALLNQRVCKLIPSEKILAKFIFYFIPEALQRINDKTAFSTVKHLSSRQVNAILLPNLPLSEQQSIVEYLDSSFAKIDKLKENAAKNLEEAKALFQSALKNALEPKEGWEEKTLKEVSLSITDGDHMPPPKANEGIPFVTISNIDKDSNTLSMKNTFYVPEDYYNNLKEERKPRKGDLLYTVTGSFGIPVVVDSNDRFCFQRHIAMIRPDNNKITSEFLYYWCLSPNAKMIADQVATGTAQRTVSLTSLRKFIIPIPSIKEQELLVSTLTTIEEKLNTLQQNYSRICDECDALKQAILRQVFE